MKTPFIIAEMSANHLGDFELAKAIIEEAAKAGADAIKLQTFTPEQMVGPLDYVVKTGPWAGHKLIDLYRQAHTSREWHKPLFDCAAKLGIEAFSTPFHPDDVAFLETLNCPRYKISSFEITDLELIRAAAETGKPLIISTGMATTNEILIAQDLVVEISGVVPTFLKCTSAYPADASSANLSAMGDDWLFAGVSDHTIGIGVAVAATALGAKVIEKHLCLNRSYGGLDAGFSMEPHEFKQMVIECRRAAAAVSGKGDKAEEMTEMRRSLWFAEDLPAGTQIERRHLKVARPAGGRNPGDLSLVVGLTLKHDVKAGDPV